MNQPSQQQPSVEHYQKVINRLSTRIGALTVEQSSMAEILIEKEREILELKQEVADLKEPADIKEPEPVN